MRNINAVFFVLLCSGLVIGCASSGDIQSSRAPAMSLGKVSTVAVSTFTCRDANIAQEVKNGIISELLDRYSVVIGEEADVKITGDIILSPKNSVSQIQAYIIKNGSVVETVNISRGDDMSAPMATPEFMAKRAGSGIKEKLSGR